MLPKTTWMRSLIIGINLGMLLTFGCGKKTVEPVSSAEYVYLNNMSFPITIVAYDYNSFKTKILQANESITLLTGGDVVTYPFVRTSLANRADSVIIQFSDAKCTTYRIDKTSLAREGGDGVFDLKEYDNYSQELVSQRSFTLKYSIDSTDYKRSKPCN